MQGQGVVVGRTFEQGLFQCLSRAETLQTTEAPGPVEQQAVGRVRQQRRGLGKQQDTIQFLGLRAVGIAFGVRRRQHQACDHQIGRWGLIGGIQHTSEPLMLFSVDLVQAQLQFSFGTQTVQARLVKGCVVRAVFVAQFQHFLRTVGVQQRGCGGGTGLLGHREGVHLLLQTLQALVCVVALKVLAQQGIHCRALLRQCLATDAQWNVGAYLAEQDTVVVGIRVRQGGGQGQDRFVTRPVLKCDVQTRPQGFGAGLQHPLLKHCVLDPEGACR
ncbi:hypothetical protein D3C71_1432090 [compost metagenome]